MASLTITRGLPGSGKTTYAREWVAFDPVTRARINRDDIRAMAHDSEHLGQPTERQIITIRDGAIAALIRQGIDVICDDTNLPDNTVEALRKVAVDAGAMTFVIISLTHVPLAECLRRNQLRTGPARVPDSVIEKMHAEHVAPAEQRLLDLVCRDLPKGDDRG